MVTDAIINAFMAVVDLLFSWLPTYELELPAVDSMVDRIAQLNSVLPIGPVIQVAVVLLGFLFVFLIVRLILLVRHTVAP
jgi:hypothetical protein